MILIDFLTTLWRFGRPHTIIGSIVSIITLDACAKRKGFEGNLDLLIGTLIAGIACNVLSSDSIKLLISIWTK
ncbi:MAG: hypothetical protein IPO92_15790 [Saprospiraceae bacterium]|nr:hypothetical protein [Saprospiraceae bacterium]